LPDDFHVHIDTNLFGQRRRRRRRRRQKKKNGLMDT
jgi:hypothetical protein